VLEGFAAVLRSAPVEPVDEPPAAGLLDGIAALEEEILATILGRPLQPMPWSEFGGVCSGSRRTKGPVDTGPFAC
jgi:hypothetical protein